MADKPDKQNENKFMAMLERRGIVRKTEPEDKPELGLRSAWLKQKAEPHPGLGQEESAPPQGASSSFQPVPGMIEPVFPERQPQRAARESQTPPVGGHIPAGDDTSWDADSFDREYGSPSNDPQRFPRGSGETFTPPPSESYNDRFLDIDALYEALSLKSDRTDTIYLVEKYLKTLPDTLPDESRRDIVTKIISASGFDYDILMGDGVLRVKMLKEYAEQFAQHTDDYISARKAELDELELRMMGIRKLIENRRDLHKKQFFAIESEAQRLKEILAFISG